jgi:hypothetical protein
MPARSRITWRAGRFHDAHGVIGLKPDGTSVPIENSERRAS